MDNEPLPLSAVAILKTLGGTTVVARAISVRRSAVSNWPRAGIPAKYWPAMARLATTIVEAKHITPDVLERHTFGDPVAERVEARCGSAASSSQRGEDTKLPASRAAADVYEAGSGSDGGVVGIGRRDTLHLVTVPAGRVDNGCSAVRAVVTVKNQGD